MTSVPIPYSRTYNLRTEPFEVFLWEQYQCLWNEDPQEVRKMLEEEIETAASKPGGGEVAKYILEDLSVGTCPAFDPQKARCSP
jgi:hypothetical protein